MMKLTWRGFVSGSIVTGIVWAAGVHAQVNVTDSRESIRQVREYVRNLRVEDELGQVTSVSEFVDVKPTDWAFQALQSLVERYGCIVGLPTKPPTYQGRRALTRYEFAAGLNACLDRMNELIAASTENLVTKEDMKLLQRLQEEFAAELALLRGRVDTLEARTATLEAQQFSTTTKLTGQVIFGVQGAFGANRQAVPKGQPRSTQNLQDAVTFGYRVNLTFNTSFTGKDLLTTNLQIDDVPLGAIPGTSALAATGTNSASVSYGFLNGGSGGQVGLDTLTYEFPVLGDKGRITIAALGGAIYDQVDTLSPLDDDGQGAISAFGLRNPIYNQNGGAGVGAAFSVNFLNDKLNFTLGYLASGDSGAGAYSPSQGLFGSSYVAYAQLTGYPLENLGLSAVYIRGYSDPNAVPLNLGGLVGNQSVDALAAGHRVSADNAGFQFKWQPLQNFIIGGWFGATWFRDEERRINASGTALNYALVFAFPDVGTRGSQAQLVVGAPPYLNSSRGLVSNGFVARRSDDVPILVEASYRFKYSEYLSITPGIFAIFNPEGNRDNPTVLVGAIRTTFSF
ncbi:MAG: iron uptake porin [Gloeomargarita sp. SKYBB_i_bin120]|nr:iron uptake porin [Gloeomargarita sp. SKYB120]MDW8178793.1 iron uptake porin [Gloeomargarita sp. SKYBB_i_bin120]